MYYKGTQAECEAYDAEVTQGQGYDGVHTIKWADTIAHPNGVDFAIRKHNDYPSTMVEVAELGDDWFPAIDE